MGQPTDKKTTEQHSEKNAAANTKSGMNRLNHTGMPLGLNDLLAGIDRMLTNAQHSIDTSLQQSTALVEQSRQQLQQFELESTQLADQDSNYAVPEHHTYSVDDDSATPSTPGAYTENVLQPALTEQQNAALESAQIARQTMDKTIKDMQQQLLAQSKAYEESVASKVASHTIQHHDAEFSKEQD